MLVWVDDGVADGWTVAVLSPSTGVGGEIDGVVSLQANKVRLNRSSRSKAAARPRRVEDFDGNSEFNDCLRKFDPQDSLAGILL